MGLRCDSAAIKATRLKLEASLYAPAARYGARVLSWAQGGGAVVLMVALLSCFAALPEHAPHSSHRSGRHKKECGDMVKRCER